LQENQEQKKKNNMVDEVFLQRAVSIRRNYLKVTNNMNFYTTKVNNVISALDDILEKLSKLQESATNDKIKNDRATTEKTAVELNNIILELELEGKKLEGYIDPLNKEIEKLALEEQELYRQIQEKNSHLSDEQIIESVRKRLEEENLS